MLAGSGGVPKELVGSFIDFDPTKISWTLSLKNRLAALRHLEYRPDAIVPATYRPFTKQYAYFERGLNHVTGQSPHFFPRGEENFGIYQVGDGSAVPFSVLMAGALPDLHVTGAGSGGQFFGRWRFEESSEEATLFAERSSGGLRRISNIASSAVARFAKAYGRSAWIRRGGRRAVMANAPVTRKNGVCEDAIPALDRSTRSASFPHC